MKRGGNWNNNAKNCRSANRNNNSPGNRNNNLGLRLSVHGTVRCRMSIDIRPVQPVTLCPGARLELDGFRRISMSRRRHPGISRRMRPPAGPGPS